MRTKTKLIPIILAVILILAIFTNFYVVASNVETDQGDGQGDKTEEEIEGGEDNGQGEGLIIATQVREKAKDMKQLREMIQERKQELQSETESMNEGKQKIYRNQNRVREAVHALLAMEDLVGGIGPQVSEIARNFSNSINKTISAEERIQTRGRFARFFIGGDVETANELFNEVTQNHERLRELKQLRADCDCDEEVEQELQEQIKELKQEQIRLHKLANEEYQYKGLFGWLNRNRKLIGGERDEYGCLGSAGYEWCEATQICQRFWEEPCETSEE